MRPLTRVLVIEDDEPLARAIARVAEDWGAQVWTAHTEAEGRELLAIAPELIVLDVGLPDGNGIRVVKEACALKPAPVVVAVSGQATPQQAFQLAQAGVRAFVPKPLSAQTLTNEVARALEAAPPIEPLVAAWVGHKPMKELQGDVRRVMVEEALARTEGSRTGAARLLRVSRQAVQQIIRERDFPWSRSPTD